MSIGQEMRERTTRFCNISTWSCISFRTFLPIPYCCCGAESFSTYRRVFFKKISSQWSFFLCSYWQEREAIIVVWQILSIWRGKGRWMEGTVFTLERTDKICTLEFPILKPNHDVHFPLLFSFFYQRSKLI
jgi:hypothetical protein